MPNKYPSPKTDFLKNKRFVEEHGGLIDSTAFSRAIETAKAEYTRQLCSMDTVDPHISMMRFQRSAGVEAFLQTLFNLAEPPMLPPKMGDRDNLEIPPGKPRRH